MYILCYSIYLFIKIEKQTINVRNHTFPIILETIIHICETFNIFVFLNLLRLFAIMLKKRAVLIALPALK